MPNKATTIKNVIIAQNALKGLSKDEQDEVYSLLYGENNALRYIKAAHQQGGNEYLWYIPADSNIAYIAEGVYLRVEQLNGTESIVISTSEILTMERDAHELHPYCAIIEVSNEEEYNEFMEEQTGGFFDGDDDDPLYDDDNEEWDWQSED